MKSQVKRPSGAVHCSCAHCGEIFGGSSNGSCAMYCGDCKTAQQRKAIDDENAKIRKERKT